MTVFQYHMIYWIVEIEVDTGYRFLARVEELENGQAKGFSIGHEKICLVKIDENLYAIEDFCAHAGGVMSTGVLDGVELICPLHGARFDVRNGRQTLGPSSTDQPTYPIHIEEGSVYVGKMSMEGF